VSIAHNCKSGSVGIKTNPYPIPIKAKLNEKQNDVRCEIIITKSNLRRKNIVIKTNIKEVRPKKSRNRCREFSERERSEKPISCCL
jgi:hypothetical protein